MEAGALLSYPAVETVGGAVYLVVASRHWGQPMRAPAIWFLLVTMNINWNLGATVASADDPQSAVEDLQGTDLLDPRTIDRAFIADTIYRDCNGEKAPILPGGEAAHPLSTPERNEFCRCVGDYLSELLSDAEIHHVATYLAATPDMLDKEQRAKETCAMFAP